MKFRDIVSIFSSRQEILVENLTLDTLHMGVPQYLLDSGEVDGELDVALIKRDEFEVQESTGSSHNKKCTIIKVVVI